MGERRSERQLLDARFAYIAAVRRLNEALIAFDNCDMPMDPGRDFQHPLAWTEEHWRIIRAVAQAFPEVVARRAEWDGLRREVPRRYS